MNNKPSRKETLESMQEIYAMIEDFEMYETVLHCYIHYGFAEREEMIVKLRAKYRLGHNVSRAQRGYLYNLLILMDAYHLICKECEQNPGQQCKTTSSFPSVDAAIRRLHSLPVIYTEQEFVDRVHYGCDRVFRRIAGALESTRASFDIQT